MSETDLYVANYLVARGIANDLPLSSVMALIRGVLGRRVIGRVV